MIHFQMKRWHSLLLTLIVVGLAVFGVYHSLEKRAEGRREIAYQLALRSYSQLALRSYSQRFKPGVTRKEVEDYLRSRNIGFRQMCRIDHRFSQSVWDDLTKIGHESAPWFCSQNNVYVAFQFAGPENNGARWSADPSDTLKAVSIFHWLEGCL